MAEGGLHETGCGERSDHRCVLYHDPAEQLSIAAAFVGEGLARGERCLYLAGEHAPVDVERALRRAGIDVGREVARGALAVLPTVHIAPPGAFDPAAVLARLRALADAARSGGFAGWRIAVEMVWASRAGVPFERLIECEALANEALFPDRPVAALCQYSRSAFPAAVLLEVLRSHPAVVVGGRTCPNPYFAPPHLPPSGAEARLDWQLGRLHQAGHHDEPPPRREHEPAAWAEGEAGPARLAFLAETSALLAASLDYEETLLRVAEMAVPFLADWSAVDLLDGDTLRRVAIAHADPASPSVVRALKRDWSRDSLGDAPTFQKLLRGEGELVPSVTEAWLEANVPDLQTRAVVRGLGLRSLVAVPLAARGRTLGALVLATAGSGRRFGPSDARLAEDLAHRCALAIDNARLLRDAQEQLAARQAAERAERASARNLRAFFDESASFIAILAPDGTLLEMNRAAVRGLGYDPREAIGRPFWDAPWWRLLPEQQALVREDVGRAARGEQVRREAVDSDARGGRRVIDRVITPLRDDAGRVVLLLGEGRDVTDLKRVERERDDLALDLARAEERQRVATDLHDGVAQALFGLAMQLGAAELRLDAEPAAAAAVLREARATTGALISQLRGYIDGLSATGGSGRPLRERLAAAVRAQPGADRVRVSLSVDAAAEGVLAAEAADHVVYVARQAVADALRHGGARQLALRLVRRKSGLVLTVRDDGPVLDPSAARRGLEPSDLERRASMVGGQLTVSARVGGGQLVRLSVPVAPPRPTTPRSRAAPGTNAERALPPPGALPPAAGSAAGQLVTSAPVDVPGLEGAAAPRATARHRLRAGQAPGGAAPSRRRPPGGRSSTAGEDQRW